MRAEAVRRPMPLTAAWLLAIGGMVVLGLLVLADGVEAVARGWLAGWLFCLSVTVGAAVWHLIAVLTGGRWIAGPTILARLASATPLVALGGVALVLVAPALYPWWTAVEGPHKAAWLSPAAFALRTPTVLVLWSVLGWFAPRGLSPLVAAVALVLHAAAVSIAGLDWVLSLHPFFGSTTFGALVAVLQLALALAAGAAAGLAPGREVADWGGLMLAATLGVFYLVAMQYLVLWTGNQPHDAAWYLPRLEGASLAVAALAFLLGILGPFLALLPSRLRAEAGWLRAVGAAQLVAGLLYLLWLVAPDLEAMDGIAAFASLALLGGIGALFQGRAA